MRATQRDAFIENGATWGAAGSTQALPSSRRRRGVWRGRLQEFCVLNTLKSRTATRVIDRETPPAGVFRAEHFEQQDSDEGH